MNKPILLRKNDYDNIYFASDFHYNHTKDFLWGPRGFKSYQEHDAFIERECDKLTEKDLLIFLGDYSLNTTDAQTSALLHKTKAKMYYIFGNHEGYHSRFYNNALQSFGEKIACASPFQIFPFSVDKTHGYGMAGITSKPDKITYFGEEAYFRIGNNFYFCKHMAPMIWDKMKYPNQFALAGHSHGNLKEATHDNFKDGKLLDVGVDNAIKYNGTAFFHIDDVDTIMNKKQIRIFDHHGNENI